MRLSALDCLRRGLRNLAANWELVLAQWLGSLLVAALLATGLAVPWLMLGFKGRSARELEELLAAVGDLSPVFLLGVVVLLALWTLAFLLYCYLQAGTYGVLTAADRQALPGLPRARMLFRTFSRTYFFGWAARFVWRFFWFINLFWGVVGVALLLSVLWLVGMVAGWDRWGEVAAVGIGCGGILPLGFLALVLAFWASVAQADLAREESGVWAASRVGLSVLGRRLGAVFLLYLLFLAAAAALSVVFIPASLAADVALADLPAVRTGAQIVLFFLQGVPNALLTVALAAALVALVRSEVRIEMRSKPEVQIA